MDIPNADEAVELMKKMMPPELFAPADQPPPPPDPAIAQKQALEMAMAQAKVRNENAAANLKESQAVEAGFKMQIDQYYAGIEKAKIDAEQERVAATHERTQAMDEHTRHADMFGHKLQQAKQQFEQRHVEAKASTDR